MQVGEFRGEGLGVSGAESVSRGVAREEYLVQPRWQRHLPLPEQRNPQDGNPHVERRGFTAQNPAAHPAQGFPARAQFRLSAPQQQTGQTGATDQTGACSTQAAPGGELHLLRQADAGCVHAGEVRGGSITQPGAAPGD